ncbi:alpha/beta hydrolase [Dyadobacter sp. LJ53]|uniref:alpha/beta fold hydrolase n=1 Tax=Dyadobacter chenwenxiniae TaxID=2906456 RepID=UPI001F31C632|nr:alpha/beta hydrolase [Dyadobacter chenwenxiniae]MCF0049022.1 alpha/beta hydrolase [Dyadobacter chenwenxiniae]
MDLPALVIFPGARTTALFWDLDIGLQPLEQYYRIYLVETNGLPNLSDGATPDIKQLGYGHWAAEILAKLDLGKANVAGASFGGLVCLKLSLVAPEMVQSIFLLNPGCLQPFSLSLENLYYNLLPILRPTRSNVDKFLNKAVLCKPFHTVSPEAERMLIDYELFALTRYNDHTQKPYDMGDELRDITSDIYLIVGDRDILFPYKKSMRNAKKNFSQLKEIVVVPNAGHGIETEPRAISHMVRIANGTLIFCCLAARFFILS